MRPGPGFAAAALFDGRCAVCSRSSAWIGERDARKRIERLDLRVDTTAARFPTLDADAVRAQMHVLTADGALLVGVDGVRAVLAELPGWSFAARFLGVPGVHAVAGVVYRAFAKHRLVFNRLVPLPDGAEPCTDACAVDWSKISSAPPE